MVLADSADGNNGFLANLLSGPLAIVYRLLGPQLAGPLGNIVNPLVTLLDFLTAPLFFVLRILLIPVALLLNVLLGPLNGVSGLTSSVGDLVTALLDRVGNALGIDLSSVSSLVAGLLPDITNELGLTRARRGLIDSTMGMLWTILNLLFRFVGHTILTVVISPLKFVYNIVTWQYHFIFGSGTTTDVLLPSLATNAGSFTDIFSAINALVSSALLNLSQSSQDTLIDILKEAWTSAKIDLLPKLDQYAVTFSNATYIPDDIKFVLKDLHSIYQILQFMGIL